MKRVFGNRSHPLPGGGGGVRAQEHDDTNTETQTDYRSFAEYNNQSRRQNSTNSAGSSNNNSSSRPQTQDPISVTPSHEVLLQDQRHLHQNNYRGFSTSMHDMFITTEYERVDCCALTCAGILQSDRDRYLLQGITPPTVARRFWLHIVFPFLLFCIAGWGALHIPQRSLNQFFTTCAVLVLVVYLIFQCVKGRTKRIEVRKELLWTKSQLQENRNQNLAVLLEQHAPDDFDQEQEYYLGQTRWDFGCAHPCCIVGCYAEDRPASEIRAPINNTDDQDDDNSNSSNSRRHVRPRQGLTAAESRHRQANLARCLWEYACPALWCGHQLQCCGICALAQEGREVEAALLPASYRRVDYISMQPISHYYPAIYQKRHGLPNSGLLMGRGGGGGGDGVFRSPVAEETGIQRLAEAAGSSSDGTKQPSIILSNLAWQLIQLGLTISGCVFVWCLMGRLFWKKALNLAVPAWRIFDWTDFIIYLTTWAQAIILTSILAYLCNRPCPTHLSLDAMVKYFAAGFCLSTAIAVFWELLLAGLTKALIGLIMAVAGVDIVEDEDGYTSPSSNGISWMNLGAGNFARTVLGRAGEKEDFLRSFGNAHPIFYTLYIAFSSFILAAFVEEVAKYYGFRMVEHPDFMTQREVEEAVTVIVQQGADEDEDDGGVRREQARLRYQQEVEQIDFSKQKKSMQSLGSAITLSMICVAMGFTCCENLVYIFIYSGSSLGTEISVLIARSFFPVHPIAAALQSIFVVKRDVEVTRTSKLGQILAPAVLFHGTYDFFILWIDYNAKRNGNYVDNGFDFAAFLSFVVSAAIIIIGIGFYLAAAKKQRARLQVIDASIESGQSVLI